MGPAWSGPPPRLGALPGVARPANPKEGQRTGTHVFPPGPEATGSSGVGAGAWRGAATRRGLTPPRERRNLPADGTASTPGARRATHWGPRHGLASTYGSGDCLAWRARRFPRPQGRRRK